MLIIKDLHASIDNKKILNGINLSIKPGELHAIMGRNGSGKSTLANIIAGREDYDIESGSILFNGKDLLDRSPEDRALNGIFMSFQYPVVIPGVNNTYFLKAAPGSNRRIVGLPNSFTSSEKRIPLLDGGVSLIFFTSGICVQLLSGS